MMMSEADILATFTRILRDLLMDDGIVLKMETRRPDVPNWDSFAYINFIVAAEGELGIRFNVAEVESFETVGDIVAAAVARLR
jgi:acyl carrier protein